MENSLSKTKIHLGISPSKTRTLVQQPNTKSTSRGPHPADKLDINLFRDSYLPLFHLRRKNKKVYQTLCKNAWNKMKEGRENHSKRSMQKISAGELMRTTKISS